MSPVPKTKFDELIDKLNTMEVGDPQNQFALARYRRDAEALLRDVPWAGNDLLGVIACLAKNIEEMHQFHERAIASSGNNPSKIFNYGTSLGRLGFLKESYEQTKMAFEVDQDENVRNALIRRSVDCGRFLEALDLCHGVSPQDIEEAGLSGVSSFLIKARDVLVVGEFSDDDMAAVFFSIQKILHSHNVYGFGSDFDVVTEAKKGFISYEVFISDDEVDVFDLDFELDESLSTGGIKEGIMNIIKIYFEDEALVHVISKIDLEIENGNHVEPLTEERMALIKDLVAGVVL